MRAVPSAALSVALILTLPAWAAPADAVKVPPVEGQTVRETVIEDDGVRIEELRVGGQTQRIVVRPKAANVKAYQILPIGPTADRPAAGQRVWHIFSF